MEDEKHQLLPTSEEQPPQQAAPRQRRGFEWYLSRAVLIVLVTFCLRLAIDPPEWLPPCEHAHELSYRGESISWKPCGAINGHLLECSDMDVPMDQFNKENSGNKTFNIPLIRLRGHNATKNLLVNPGGPGGSGIGFLYRMGGPLNTVAGEDYNIVSFDPRGINSSTPQALCYPSPIVRSNLGSVRDKDLIVDSPEVYAWTTNFVKACAETMGEYGPYINTPQTAADMNSILDALGQEKLHYWGFSYGTILGQTYATLFPDRVERVIIDGVANNFDWYDDLLDAESLADTQHVLDGFVDECVKAKENCTLNTLASSKEELAKKIVSFGEELKESPISVYVDTAEYGLLDYETVWYSAIFPALYKPSSWHTVADRLTKLMQGNSTEAWEAYGSGSPFNIPGDSNAFVTLNDGKTGKDNWPQDRHFILDKSLALVEKQPYAVMEAESFYKKQQWSLPNTHHFVQKKHVETAHPLLILSTSYDPVCPLISARSARSIFKDSRLIEVLGYGHCSIAVPSTCLAKHVQKYLHTGKLPEKDLQCEVDTPYFMPPEGHAEVMMALEGNEDEDSRLLKAQMELARDVEW